MININLIAERRTRRIREMTILRISMLSVAALTVVMVLLIITAFSLNYIAKKDLAIYNLKLLDQDKEYADWQKIQDEIAEKQPIVSLLEQVQMSEIAWMTILADLSRITPRNVTIEGFNTNASDKEGVQIRIAGHASNAETVGEFMLAFSRDTGWAGNPELKNLSDETKTSTKPSVKFEIMVPVRGLVGGVL